MLPLNQFKQLVKRARGSVRHAGLHHRAATDSFEGVARVKMCEEPLSPSLCEGDQWNPRLVGTTLGLPFRKEEGVKQAMLPLSGLRDMDVSVSC